MNDPNEPNVQPEDNPQPQGEGEPEYFDVAADDDDDYESASYSGCSEVYLQDSALHPIPASCRPL